MAVRFTAESQAFTGALNIGAQTIYSMCGWVKLSVDRNAFSAPFGVDNNVATNCTYFQTNSDGTSQRCLFDNSTATNMGAHTVNTWTFIAMSVNGNNVTAYQRILGAPSFTTYTSTPANTSVTMTTLRVGRFFATGEWWNGAVAGIRLWTGVALTATEWAAEFGSLSAVRRTNLAGEWLLTNNTTTADTSGNNRNLTGGTGSTTEASPALTSSSPTVTVWNGTAEVTATITVWNGTTEIAGTFTVN